MMASMKAILILPLFCFCVLATGTYADFSLQHPFQGIPEKLGLSPNHFSYADRKAAIFPFVNMPNTSSRLPAEPDQLPTNVGGIYDTSKANPIVQAQGTILPGDNRDSAGMPADQFPVPKTPVTKVVGQELINKPPQRAANRKRGQLLPIERNLPTAYNGQWEFFKDNSGVSAMHVNLLPFKNKMIILDASAFHISAIKLPDGAPCIPWRDERTNTELMDCWAHAVEFDINTGFVRPLRTAFDPWCSSGGLAPDGTLVSTGGWADGERTVRFIKSCDNCDFMESQYALAAGRWYGTQATLPDGSFILFGGRRSFSYEFVPRQRQVNPPNSQIDFQFLWNSTDIDENNLYPFVYLSTDGNLFVFANRWAVLLDYKTGQLVRKFPPLLNSARNYPASAMSALLPIKLRPVNPAVIRAEVIVCGGNTPDAYAKAGQQIFLPALRDCQRIDITSPVSTWRQDIMPSPRTMGDMLILPTADLLMINGAKSGTSAWGYAEDPNFVPILYTPDKPKGQRFKELAPTTIPRMYHSSSAVLPDGKIFVGGSNTNPGYDYRAKYPTELRIEKFWPPYLAPELQIHRPDIIVSRSFAAMWTYGKGVTILFNLNPADNVVLNDDIMVTIYPPPFTTHGYSMNQRLVVLGKNYVGRVRGQMFKTDVVAPPSGTIAPPGYYMLFVVYRGVPSVGKWVQILN